MANKNEQFSEIHRKNMEAAMRLAELSVDNSQKVLALQNELARHLMEAGVKNAKAQAAAKTPEEVMELRTRYTKETTQQMMDCAQKLAEIGNASRGEFSRLLTEQLAAGSQEMADAFQSFFKSMPGQNPNMMESMQQAMANANSAFEQIAKASAAAFGKK